MKILVGNIWDFFDAEEQAVVVIPTNRTLNKFGALVMGAGLAKQAKERYPELPRAFASSTECDLGGGKYIFSAATKTDWRESSSETLVRNACLSIKDFASVHPRTPFFIPLLGAGLGGIKPQIAKKIILEVLGSLRNINLVLGEI